MLLRLIEDGKPEIFHQQIYDLLVIIARIDVFFTAKSFSQNASFFCERAGLVHRRRGRQLGRSGQK